MGSTERTIQEAVHWLRLGVETLGALVIAVGIVVALALLARSLWSREGVNFNRIRLVFARYLALALEFQLGSDILSTAVAPTWTQIGQLGAIAVIRTALNFFLTREIKEESARAESELVAPFAPNAVPPISPTL